MTAVTLSSASSSSMTARVVAWSVLLVIAAFAIAVPWLSTFAVQRLLVEVFTLFAVALAWNLLAGYGGLVAIGLHVFVGVGAYSLFALSNQLQLNPFLLLPAAALSAAAFALVSAWPMFRLSGAYFAVGTWVLAEMMRILTLNSSWLGAGGGMPLEAMGDIDRWTRNAGVYWAALFVGVGSLVASRQVLRGALGLALMSVRDSELAALASGVPVARAKIALWVLCAVMAGVAGAVSYMNTLQVTPDASFSLNWTAAAIFIAVLGGIGTLEGPIVGTIVYFLLRETFAGYGAWYFIGVGLLAILTMVAAPGGAVSLIPEKWRLDPFRIRRRMAESDPDRSASFPTT
ncbi:branched-chain amino acid ABC transporter permease [Bradyrhizobium elkanii]